MQSEQKPSDLGGPTAEPPDRGDRNALVRLFESLSEADQQELLRYAINLARKPKS